MTVQRYEPGEAVYVPPPAQNISGGAMRLVEWADEARAAHALAEALCKTPFAGAYKNDPGAATAAILKGAEVGLTPVTALGAFDLIQGQPAPKAMTLRALVQSHGHEIILVESTTEKCVMKGRRRDSEEWQTVTWTIERAHRLGVTGKDNWSKQPQSMLLARATSEISRLVGSDVILGIGYSAEEYEDDMTPAPVRRIGRAKAAKPPMPEPPLDDPPDPDATPDLLNPQSALGRKMFALMNDHGTTDRDDRLALVASIIGRQVGSSKEMTEAEAQQVCDELESRLAEPFGAEPPLDAS